MALLRPDPEAFRRMDKRRERNQRRARRMENAVRRGIYLRPFAAIVAGLAALATALLHWL